MPLRVLGEWLRQHLDGDFTALGWCPPPVHFSHAPLADLFQDFGLSVVPTTDPPSTQVRFSLNVTPEGG
jgi:hypothetical protein